ncbi:MAG: hypothetical protein AAF541_04400 [Pseudomonadota bacterium]
MQSNKLPNLYSLTAIGVGTFLGSVLAAGYMLASNYNALGQKKIGHWVIGISIVWVVLLILLPAEWSTSPTFAVVFLIGQVVLVLAITQKLQGAMFTSFEEMGGKYFSIWRAVAIGVIASFALIIIASLMVSLFGLAPTPTAST